MLKRRITKLQDRLPDPKREPQNSDDMIAWLRSLPAQERKRLQAQARARVRAWELETYGQELNELQTPADVTKIGVS